MMKYRYNGEITVALPRIGKVDPGQTIVTRYPINHPNFVEVRPEVKTAKKAKGK